jgi:hypothetical protein
MFGYVITNNNIGTESGFWSPFPRVVVKLSDMYCDWFGKWDRNGNYRWSWEYWSYREEMKHRRTCHIHGVYSPCGICDCVTCKNDIACPVHNDDFTVTYG